MVTGGEGGSFSNARLFFLRVALSCQIIAGTQGMVRDLLAQATAPQQDLLGPARGKARINPHTNSHFSRVQEIERGKRACSGPVLMQWQNNAMQETKGCEQHLGEHLGEQHLGDCQVMSSHKSENESCWFVLAKTMPIIFYSGSDDRPASSASKNTSASYLFMSLLLTHRLPPA